MLLDKSGHSFPFHMRSFRYILFYKPYHVLSQFSDDKNRETLKHYLKLPKNIYSIGRLDYDSEGLLLLTDDRSLTDRILDPKYAHPRTYLVQVENIPTIEAIKQLRAGIVIENKKTLSADVSLLSEEPLLPRRSAPIRFRKNVPTAWLEITVREGRNRQVRKMTAAVGHPTIRLVRTKIGALTMGDLQPGAFRSLSCQEVLHAIE